MFSTRFADFFSFFCSCFRFFYFFSFFCLEGGGTREGDPKYLCTWLACLSIFRCFKTRFILGLWAFLRVCLFFFLRPQFAVCSWIIREESQLYYSKHASVIFLIPFADAFTFSFRKLLFFPSHVFCSSFFFTSLSFLLLCYNNIINLDVAVGKKCILIISGGLCRVGFFSPFVGGRQKRQGKAPVEWKRMIRILTSFYLYIPYHTAQEKRSKRRKKRSPRGNTEIFRSICGIFLEMILCSKQSNIIDWIEDTQRLAKEISHGRKYLLYLLRMP